MSAMKRLGRFLGSMLGISGPAIAFAADYSTPEAAVRSLESAYVRKDIEAAVAAKDFATEALLMLKKISPELSNDQEILKQTAEVLELTYRNEMQTTGFPDFSNLKCSFESKVELAPDLVKLTEVCVFPDGGKSVQDVHVSKGESGWHVVTVPS